LSPLVSILSRMNLVHTFQHNICHLCVGLPSGLLPSGFPTKILFGVQFCITVTFKEHNTSLLRALSSLRAVIYATHVKTFLYKY
jgi:hypothetical protein